MPHVFKDPSYDAGSDIGQEFEPTSSTEEIHQRPIETAACEVSSDGPSQSRRQAQSSDDLRRKHESTRSEEEINIDKKIKRHRIGPNTSDAMEDRFEFLLVEYYVKPKRPDTPEVQEKLSLTLKNIKPFSYDCPTLSVAEKNDLKKILKNLLDSGIIRKSNSRYISRLNPMAMDDTHCLKIDYRHLNKFLDCDRHPLPAIEDQLVILGNKKKYFSMIKLEDAHRHIEIEEEYRKYTSFMTPSGQYEFIKMPDGLKIGPAQFQRFMRAVMSELIDTAELIVTMDGILVATETDEEHLQILKRVFERFVRNKIVIAIDKSEFLRNEIEYFNYLISLDGVRPSMKGLEVIRQFPIPKDHEELDRFVKLCKYFKKFIEGFEIIAEPLRDLLQKNRNFEFGERQVEAFETLKVKLTNAPTLAIFTLEDETELHCDASPHGFGAVLLQRKDDNEMHPIFYFSQRTSPIEKETYGSDRLERCAVGYAVQHFITYLRGIPFKIVTDADSVRWVLNRDKPDVKTDSWIRKILWTLDCIVEQRPRSQMEHVDALSRPIDSA